MYGIWTGAELLAVCCILLGGHIVAQDEESDEVVRAFEFDNATLTWPVPEKASGETLAIRNVSNKIILTFLLGNSISRAPRVVPADAKNTTFGFTIHNVTFTDAGAYRCQSEGKSCGRNILFIWGRPAGGRVIPEGDRLRCDVQLTSQPAEHRLPGANMEYQWCRDMSPSGALNNTVLGNVTREPYITPGHADNGSFYSCFGKEGGSRLWSDSGDWYQYVFYGPVPAVPDERNGSSASPNVTDTGKDKGLDIDPGSPEFLIIVSLVSLVAVLIIAVTIALVVLCRRKNSTECQQNAANDQQMAAKGQEQYSDDEEDSTVLVDNTEYSDNNYFGSDSGQGEYSDIREIERLRIKGRGPAPLPKNENIYELQEAVQVSDEHKAKLDNKDDEDEERIVTDIYAVPMKKGTLK